MSARYRLPPYRWTMVDYAAAFGIPAICVTMQLLAFFGGAS